MWRSIHHRFLMTIHFCSKVIPKDCLEIAALLVLYVQKFFGLSCHDRIAWRSPKKSEKCFYFLTIPSSLVFFFIGEWRPNLHIAVR